MKSEDIQIGKMYEARVPGGPRERSTGFNPVLVVGMGDSFDHGDSQMVAVLYKAPLSPRGQRIALVSPMKLRLYIPKKDVL